MNIKISHGNSKLGNIPSISLPSLLTCINNCGCNKKCYARRIENYRSSVKNAYKTNLEILKKSPDIFWREIEASIMMSRFFRFHVSGDIPDSNYFEHMIEVASRNPHCNILCFTKKYDIVNDFVSRKIIDHENEHGTALNATDIIPSNLHIIFSAWRGLEMNNTYGFPEAHVRYKDDGSTTASPDAKECGGNCSSCAVVNEGCWNLKMGEQIVFNEH